MVKQANNVLEFMGKDHDRLDKIFEQFRKTKNIGISKAKPFFHDFKTGLQRHIVWEEEILFPIFEDKTGMHDTGPTTVMRAEHRQIKGFLEKIKEKIEKGEITGVDGLEKELLEVLKAHNDKEENILYPWIDGQTSGQEKEKAFTKMKNLQPEKYNKCCD